MQLIATKKKMIKRRHHLSLEDFQRMISCLEVGTGSLPDNLLRVEDVADILHVKPMTVWAWVCGKKPRINHLRVDSLVRFPKVWLLEWAKEEEESLKRWNFEL